MDEVSSQFPISGATFIHLAPCRDHNSESRMQTLGHVTLMPHSCVLHNYCIQAVRSLGTFPHSNTLSKECTEHVFSLNSKAEWKTTISRDVFFLFRFYFSTV